MDIYDGLPVLRFHFKKGFIPQDSRIVNQNIHRAECVQCRFYNVFSAFRRGDGVEIGNGFASLGPDFCYNIVCRSRCSFSGTVTCTAQIVDDDLCTAFGKFQGVDPAKAASGSGDDGHTIVKANFIFWNLSVFEDSFVDDRLFSFGIDRSPERSSVFHFPDKGSDGCTRV